MSEFPELGEMAFVMDPAYWEDFERDAVERWGLDEFRRRVGRDPVYMTQDTAKAATPEG